MQKTLKVAGEATDIAIGDRIKTIRKTVGLSQEKVAEHLGVTFQQMQKYEKGTNRVGVHALLEMCKVFRCQPMDILSAAWDGGNDDDDVFTDVVTRTAELQRKIEAARKALA
jgi:transcriptional regulator with XRE-family HTH domain